MHNHLYEMSLICMGMKSISFPYERMSTKPRFEKEAKRNSEMVYLTCNTEEHHCYKPTNPVGGVLPEQLGAASKNPYLI